MMASEVICALYIRGLRSVHPGLVSSAVVFDHQKWFRGGWELGLTFGESD